MCLTCFSFYFIISKTHNDVHKLSLVCFILGERVLFSLKDQIVPRTMYMHFQYIYWEKMIKDSPRKYILPWSYDSWINNYMCNQWLSQLKLWVRTPFMARCTWQQYVIKFVSDLRRVGGFPRVLRFPPAIKLTTTI